ncbi:MAG TPA: outer membrane beta-barrel protein [Longimicrobiaceae bacterium]|nr:outer membrane beta-barrel protein [Longimicrobiaceae bacterium]
MKKAFAGLLVALALAAGTGRAAAQGTLPLSFGVRIDAGIPVGDDADGVDTGFGWGVEAAFDLTPTFAIYGGFSQFTFGIDDSEADFDEDGFELGGRVLLGTGGAVWTPFGQFGAVFHEGEVGFEAGLGADYPVGNALSLTPLVRYRNIDSFQYVAIGVGLNLRL